MAIGSRSWRTLMRRNLLYRRRHFITTIFEMGLPLAFLGIVVALRQAADIDEEDFVSQMKSLNFHEQIADFISMLVTLGLLYPTAAMIRYMVAEKEERQKELIKMMGVTESDIGWAWFTTFFSFHLITATLAAVLCKLVYKQSQFFLLWVFWIVSFMAFITLAMALASFFSKTTRATFCGLLVYFSGYFVAMAVDFATGDPIKLRLTSLHPVAAFKYGFREIGRLEDEDGATILNIWTTDYEAGFTMQNALRYLFFDAVIFGVIAWYLNRVIPHSYGQALPFYFPFRISYWCPSFGGNNHVDQDEVIYDEGVPVEPVSASLKMQARERKNIEIRGLRKTFGDKHAIDGLNLSIYNGQITALLGHNGAGKSTLINILTGAMAPSGGDAVVSGHNIRTSMQKIRENMGICLQHDCLFPNMTVREHLRFFSRLKGVYAENSWKDAEEMVQASMRDVALLDKSETLAKNLSGGMKRKLSVAIAFCGGSKLVVLDEPTSGMDPFSRRYTWNVIRQYREQNRSIWLTTHHMDEADCLGDRIAIMAEGQLRCCGSSLFLKKAYGVGYQLTLEKKIRAKQPSSPVNSDHVDDIVVDPVKEASLLSHAGTELTLEKNIQPSRQGGNNDGCVDETLKSIVVDSVKEASILSNVGTEMKFQLPMSASAQFSALLQRLDSEIASGTTINSYGLNFTSLEEVFILVARGESAGADKEAERKALETSRRLADSVNASDCLSRKDFQRDGLFLRHVHALFVKRALGFKRDRKAWIFTTVLPLSFVFLGFVLVDSLTTYAIWFLVVLSFPFIAGSFGSFVVAEKQSKAKHLQTLSGVSSSAYWISTLLWDVMTYQATLWITVILMFAFGIEELTTTKYDVVGGVIALLVAFGPAAASFTYCVSFIFSSPSFCNAFVIIFGFMTAMGGTVASFLLWFFGNGPLQDDEDIIAAIGEDSPLAPKENLISAGLILRWVLRIFPSFCLGNGLFNAINMSESMELIVGGSSVTTVWHENVLLYDVIFLIAESFLYLALAIYIDRMSNNPKAMMMWRRFVRLITCSMLLKSEVNVTYTSAEDDDVLNEEQRVLHGGANADTIVMKKLSKVYDNGKVAVNHLSLGIPPGECFGLLGINGAGKTSTMGMLTTEFPPSSGDTLISGFSIRDEPEMTRSRIGYCPQFDAHFQGLTGREHVELYAKIKGTPAEFVKSSAAAKLASVGLSEYDSNKLSSKYSGGMKRRLSLACATIGQPEIVLLDECSTGVDPVGRRDIWQMISDMLAGKHAPQDEKPSVVITTHSMEECEALASRIAIMAHGRLRCLGSAQHLKTKFGQGYQLELKVKTVGDNDEDYRRNLFTLGRQKPGLDDAQITAFPDRCFFNLQGASVALQVLSGDTYLYNMLNPSNPNGCPIYNYACSPDGVQLDHLACFATAEFRKRRLAVWVSETFQNPVLREVQDLRLRYELPSVATSIAAVFEAIEATKNELMLDDYGVSQTSLEQVFNMHAAEADLLKGGANTNPQLPPDQLTRSGNVVDTTREFSF